MHLAYVLSQYPTLTETFIAREVNQLASLGHNITLCVLRPRPQRGLSGTSSTRLRVLRMPMPGVRLLAAQISQMRIAPRRLRQNWFAGTTSFARPSRLWQVIYLQIAAAWFAERLSATPVDYVHGHFLHSEAIGAMLLARLLQVPYGITSHVSSVRHDRRLVRKAVMLADVLVGDTLQTVRVYQELAGRPATLIRNGVDVSAFVPSRTAEWRPDSIPVILAVGTLLELKGFHVLIQACADLRQRGIPFRCRIIGEGPERGNLERLIVSNGLDGHVSLPGAMSFSDLVQEYAKASTLVMPSVASSVGSDGLPTVLIEAMAMGIPVVGTRHAGIPDLVRHRETGMLAEPGDPGTLAACIADVLVDSALRDEVTANGRRLIAAEYDLRKNVASFVQVVEEPVRRRWSTGARNSQA